MIGIVESRADEASEHVCEHVRDLGGFVECEDAGRPDAEGGGTYYRSDAFELRSFEALHLELDGVATAFDDPEYVVFASRHSGDTGPLLSAHPTGNVGDAEYGGKPGELADAPTNALAAAIDRLAAHAPAGYDVSMECTHHGPSDVGAPGMFVEVGSGPEQWADPDGARAVARAIRDLADVPPYASAEVGPDTAGAIEGSREATDPRDDARRRHLVGFGGGHYAPRFTRIARETDWAVGHVAANWSLEALGDPTDARETIAAAFERSRAARAVIDGDRPALAAVAESLGYDVVGETWVRETTGVPLDVVDAAEDRLRTVDDGLRFGEPARRENDRGGEERAEPTPDLETCPVVSLPSDLLARAQAIDRQAAVEAVGAVAVAYETEEGGTRIGDRALVGSGETASEDSPDRGAAGNSLPEECVDSLLAILREDYDEVRREDDRIVAETTAFDPGLAREAGVEEGPAFGRLASGEVVTVDGRAVRPEEVASRRRHEFEL